MYKGRVHMRVVLTLYGPARRTCKELLDMSHKPWVYGLRNADGKKMWATCSQDQHLREGDTFQLIDASDKPDEAFANAEMTVVQVYQPLGEGIVRLVVPHAHDHRPWYCFG